MEISVSTRLANALPQQLPTAAPAPTADGTTPVARKQAEDGERTHGLWNHHDDDEHGHVRRHGRRFAQRGARHLLRDIRHQVKDELKELRAGGDTEKAQAVRAAYHDFRDGVKQVLADAGRGHDVDRAAIAQGLGEAMAAFTAALRALNGPVAEETVPAPVVDETPTATSADKLPQLDEALPAGSLLDLGA